MEKGQHWTEEENLILQSNISILTYEQIVGLLPGRSLHSVTVHARRKGWHVLVPNPIPKLFGTQTASSEELAYIAGFLDGEGCITLIPRKKNKNTYLK